MTETEKKARELFATGHNCAQSVFCAVCAGEGINQDDALRAASAFGGGMAGTRGTCGAVCGMLMAYGWLWGYTEAKTDPSVKADTYAGAKALMDEFQRLNGSTICRELLGLAPAPGGPLPKKKPCQELVALAVELIEGEKARRGE